MRYPLLFAAAAVMGMGNGAVAHADNAAVEKAIQERPDLSVFYQALVNTGVNHELNPGENYTIFAPTNDAFARVRQQYPCFYMAECRSQVADIVRNHIVHGDVYIDDAAKHKGGLYSLGGRFVPIGEPVKDDFTVDGNNVLYSSAYSDGYIYKLDGLVANEIELSALQFEPVERTGTTVTSETIPDPSCGPAGCPDEVTSTTVTRTFYPSQASQLAPSEGVRVRKTRR